VSGTDRAALAQAIEPYRRDPFKWNEVSPSLEDVFIQLMGRTPDDRYTQ
jgi:ABC-2 type transport system ATP-binding protein